MADDFRLGEWLVQPSLNSVSHNGSSQRLEPKVMEVLVCLAQGAGKTVPKEHLLKTVWPDTFVTDDGLIRSISELRRVFEDDAREPRVIQTIPKRGYRLVAPVEPANRSGNNHSSTALFFAVDPKFSGSRRKPLPVEPGVEFPTPSWKIGFCYNSKPGLQPWSLPPEARQDRFVDGTGVVIKVSNRLLTF